MSNSVLVSTKKVLGLSEDYTAFDEDIIMHINMVFSTLNQLGVGPEEGFAISDANAEWDAFFTDPRLNSIKSYVYLRVRLLFDPPTNSFYMAALQEQIKELEFRINVYQETPSINGGTSESILDGGTSLLT